MLAGLPTTPPKLCMLISEQSMSCMCMQWRQRSAVVNGGVPAAVTWWPFQGTRLTLLFLMLNLGSPSSNCDQLKMSIRKRILKISVGKNKIGGKECTQAVIWFHHSNKWTCASRYLVYIKKTVQKGERVIRPPSRSAVGQDCSDSPTTTKLKLLVKFRLYLVSGFTSLKTTERGIQVGIKNVCPKMLTSRHACLFQKRTITSLRQTDHLTTTRMCIGRSK